MALLKAGVPRDAPEMKSGIDKILSHMRGSSKYEPGTHHTYEAGVGLMALANADEKQHLVAAIGGGMDRLRQKGARSREGGRSSFGESYGDIDQKRLNDVLDSLFGGGVVARRGFAHGRLYRIAFRKSGCESISMGQRTSLRVRSRRALANLLTAISLAVLGVMPFSGPVRADPPENAAPKSARSDSLKIGTLAPAESPWGQVFKTWQRAVRERALGEAEPALSLRIWGRVAAKEVVAELPAGMNMRFTNIRLQNWRNFKNAEVELSSRAFLVGPNAAGKSNLLDAFRFLRDVSIGGLAAAVDSRGGISSLRCVQATSNTDIGISVDMGSDTEPKLWSYALKFNRHKVLKEPAVVSEEEVSGPKHSFENTAWTSRRLAPSATAAGPAKTLAE
jgi:hypothetical protein